jgi:ribosome-binding factor A
MTDKNLKKREILRELAAQFLSKESNRQSLITVTDVEFNDRANRAIILITVLPIEMEKDAVEFVHRQLGEFREFVSDNSRLARIPYFDVRIDQGEKNRQRIDELGRNI